MERGARRSKELATGKEGRKRAGKKEGKRSFEGWQPEESISPKEDESLLFYAAKRGKTGKFSLIRIALSIQAKHIYSFFQEFVEAFFEICWVLLSDLGPSFEFKLNVPEFSHLSSMESKLLFNFYLPLQVEYSALRYSFHKRFPCIFLPLLHIQRHSTSLLQLARDLEKE
jgi:hypothetical protein